MRKPRQANAGLQDLNVIHLPPCTPEKKAGIVAACVTIPAFVARSDSTDASESSQFVWRVAAKGGIPYRHDSRVCFARVDCFISVRVRGTVHQGCAILYPVG